MSGPFQLGHSVTFAEAGRQYDAVIESTWQDGHRAVVRLPDGAAMSIRSNQLDKPIQTAAVKVDLAEAESLAVTALAGETPAGSVTGQMLTLAAAVLTLRQRRAG
jgi:hypothetical protein